MSRSSVNLATILHRLALDSVSTPGAPVPVLPTHLTNPLTRKIAGQAYAR